MRACVRVCMRTFVRLCACKLIEFYVCACKTMLNWVAIKFIGVSFPAKMSPIQVNKAPFWFLNVLFYWDTVVHARVHVGAFLIGCKLIECLLVLQV